MIQGTVLPVFTLNMKAEWPSKTLLSYRITKRCHSPRDLTAMKTSNPT